jgi:hypothetical protein
VRISPLWDIRTGHAIELKNEERTRAYIILLQYRKVLRRRSKMRHAAVRWLEFCKYIPQTMLEVYPNSSISLGIARSPLPLTKGRNGEPSYKTIVTPLASPETSQCHIIPTIIQCDNPVKWRATYKSPSCIEKIRPRVSCHSATCAPSCAVSASQSLHGRYTLVL